MSSSCSSCSPVQNGQNVAFKQSVHIEPKHDLKCGLLLGASKI